jgi:hypothetical protein
MYYLNHVCFLCLRGGGGVDSLTSESRQSVILNSTEISNSSATS